MFNGVRKWLMKGYKNKQYDKRDKWTRYKLIKVVKGIKYFSNG